MNMFMMLQTSFEFAFPVKAGLIARVLCTPTRFACLHARAIKLYFVNYQTNISVFVWWGAGAPYQTRCWIHAHT